MQIDFKIGQGMQFPVITGVLQYGDGSLIPLDVGGPTVTFTMRREGYPTPKINAQPATIVNVSTSQVEYDFLAPDTNEPGQYLGFWTVTYGTGKKVMVPDDGFIYIAVVPT